MSDTKETVEKPVLSARTKTMSLGGAGEGGPLRTGIGARPRGPVKQTYVVETKKKRTITAGGVSEEAAPKPMQLRPQPLQQPVVPVVKPAADRRPAAAPGAAVTGKRAAGGLSDDERDARMRALSAAREREAIDRVRAEEDQRRRAIHEAEAKRKAEEDRKLLEAEARKKAKEAAVEEDEAPVREQPSRRADLAATPAPAAIAARPATGEPRFEAPPARPALPSMRYPQRVDAARTTARAVPSAEIVVGPTKAQAAADPKARVPVIVRRHDEEEDEGARRPGSLVKRAKPAGAPVKRVEEKAFTRTGGKVSVDQIINFEERHRSEAAARRRREKERLRQLGPQQPREKVMREVIIPEMITIQELSNRMAERAVDIIKLLMKQGAMHKITDVIDSDTAELLVAEFGHTSKRVSESDVEEGFIGIADDLTKRVARAPIVTIMGHVDHGKTSLLDAIRETNVVSGEAGGITQHIGAYQVMTPRGMKVTFIDTPGHEAFTAMRSRGAKVTDIVILVVAADDGVMPQTIEAINHAKAAGVPIIVAINKVDKQSADPKRVRTELLSHDIVVESMGGETLEIEVSALKKQNLEKLLDAIALQAEILELSANPDRSAEGIVIEAKLETGRGPVGTVLIQRGTLHVGDIIVAGNAWGRVRALLDAKGTPLLDAGPSVPVEVLGFSSAPEAGDQLAVVENEARAREITDYRIRKRRERSSVGGMQAGRTLEQMMLSLKGEGRREFAMVVKGDVQGSVEAINASLDKLGTEEVAARIIHSAVGGITESDIALASASGAIIVGFNVRANVQARALAEREGIEIRYYSIIYDLVDDVKKAMSGLLAPTQRETHLGNAEILEVFNITKVGKVAGCRVSEGKVERGAEVRLIRDNVVIHRGKLSTLKRFKDEVKDVPVGQECGMAFEAYQDMRAGDVIECFRVETIARSL